MRRFILAPTPAGQEAIHRKLLASVNHASSLIFLSLLSVIALWVGHATGWIPLLPHAVEFPPSIAGAIARIEEPATGATAFLIAPDLLVTSFDGLSPSGGDVEPGSKVVLTFHSAFAADATVEASVLGPVEDSEGNRLVFIRLQNPRPDPLALPPLRPKQSTQVVAAGFPAEANDLGVYRASMVISGEFCSILWPETSTPGPWEGFPVFSASDFRVYGVLIGGVNIVPLTEASVRTWLEQLETGSPR